MTKNDPHNAAVTHYNFEVVEPAQPGGGGTDSRAATAHWWLY